MIEHDVMLHVMLKKSQHEIISLSIQCISLSLQMKLKKKKMLNPTDRMTVRPFRFVRVCRFNCSIDNRLENHPLNGELLQIV